MPMDFPDMRSLVRAAEVHKFRAPLPEESEADFRQALHHHVLPRDRIESFEILFGVGWNQFNDEQKRQLMPDEMNHLINRVAFDNAMNAWDLANHKSKSNKPKPKFKTDYGIGEEIVNRVYQYYQHSRAIGRTSKMIEAAKDGDKIIFSDHRERERVERIFREQGKDVKCVVVRIDNPHEALNVFAGRRGDTFFDHTWVEKYYLASIERAEKQLETLHEQFSWPKLEDKE